MRMRSTIWLVAGLWLAAVPGVVHAENGEDRPPKSWRIQDDGTPPIQVTRAVRTVVSSAKETAREISGEPVAENDAAAAPPPKLRTVQRETSTESDQDKKAQTQRSRRESWMDAARRLLDRGENKTYRFEPYVDDPRWDRAMRFLVEDECKKSLDLIDTIFEEASDEKESEWRRMEPVEYAVGRVKMCAGQPGEGKATLRRLRGRDGAVAEIAARRLGADPSPIQVAEDAEDKGLWQRMAEAKRLAARGELEDALGELGSLHASVSEAWQRYKVRMAEADLLLQHGRLDDAARAFLGVYEMARDWNLADDLSDRIESVERRTGLEILSLSARVDRMRELIQRGRYEKAKQVSIQNAKLAGISGREIEGWSFYRRALEAERKRRRNKADEYFAKAEARTENPVIRSRIYYGWARALRRLDRDDEAIELYDRLCSEFPRHRLCDDATYEAGRLYQYGNQHQKARDKFVEVVGLFPESDHVPDALWRGAFSAYVMGDYDAVDRPLKRLVNRYGQQTDASGLSMALKGRYWLGAAAFKRGDMDLAIRRLRQTVQRGALTWYGALAAARLQMIGEPPMRPVPPSDLTQSGIRDLASLRVPQQPRLAVAEMYARLGLYGNAADEVRRQLQVAPKPEKARTLLGVLWLRAGEISKAQWMMARHLEPSAPSIYSLREWGIAYPLAFMDVVQPKAMKYGISPFLMQGVIRQESGFQADISSYAGAVGLMQLMPNTANHLSDNYFDGSYVSRSALTDPANNVQYGAIYLKYLEHHTRGSVPMMLAGYNAGPAPLESWFERFGDREMDAWVESITYREARGYVRKVYTNYLRYAALYDGDLPEVAMDLPDDLGDWTTVQELRQNQASEPVSRRSSPRR